MRRLLRAPQLRSEFTPGRPAAGYYNDLTLAVGGCDVTPEHAGAVLELARSRRPSLNPVSHVQAGLGAWQRAESDERWLELARSVGDWIELDMDGHGRLAYLTPMSHTYDLPAPWFSAMAQGQAASLLVRLDGGRIDAALRAAGSLLDAQSPLVAMTDEGPVLQEYPTRPPSHVLNGWIFALWGLYDLAHALAASGRPEAQRVRRAWEAGVDALEGRLGSYELGSGWTRYDLFPHPIVHVASPFYHRLHAEQMDVMAQLTGRASFADAHDRWSRALDRPITLATAVVRKVGFRIARPRRRAS